MQNKNNASYFIGLSGWLKWDKQQPDLGLKHIQSLCFSWFSYKHDFCSCPVLWISVFALFLVSLPQFLFVHLYLHVSQYLCFCVQLCLRIWVSLCVQLSFFKSVPLHLVHLSPPLLSVCVHVRVCVWERDRDNFSVYMCLCLCISLSGYESFSVSVNMSHFTTLYECVWVPLHFSVFLS